MGSRPRAGSSEGLERGGERDAIFPASPRVVISRMANTSAPVCKHTPGLIQEPWVLVLTLPPGDPENVMERLSCSAQAAVTNTIDGVVIFS